MESVREMVEERSKLRPIDNMESDGSPRRSLRKAIIKASGAPVISEIKRKSPSSGIIRPNVDVAEVSKAMANGGSVGISVLTEPKYFDGRLNFVPIVRKATSLPVLRKDFIVDKYQLYESSEVGADAVLLIAEVLNGSLSEFVEKARDLGIESLVEVSTEEQVDLAIEAEPDFVGINNRDLATMDIDLSRTERLAGRIPDHMITISESGIGNASDVRRMLEAGADAVLVGTSIMSSSDIEIKIQELGLEGVEWSK